MARQFTAKAVLHHLATPSRHKLLSNYGCQVSPCKSRRRDLDSVVASIASLPAEAFDLAESDLMQIHAMATTRGMEAINEVVTLQNDDEMRRSLFTDINMYERAAWMLMNRPEAFRQAEQIFVADSISWWSKRNDLPCGQPDTSRRTLDGFGAAVSEMLESKEGRGRVCTVDHFHRNGTHFFSIYPDDYLRPLLVHDEGRRLTSISFRPTFCFRLAYKPAEGSLELSRGIAKRRQPEMESLFAKHILKADLAAAPPKSAFRLDGLKNRGFSIATDPSDQIQVSIRELRLKQSNSPRFITLNADPRGGAGDIYDLLDETLGPPRPEHALLHVTRAKLCFKFDGGKRPRTICFELSHPSGCTLRNVSQDKSDLIYRYLRQWGIDDVQADR